MKFEWYTDEMMAYTSDAMRRALESGGAFGQQLWQHIAPVGTDPRTSGDLRRSWVDFVQQHGQNLALILAATARYAIYVELGTSKMSPRAPLRATAAEVVAILPYYFAAELRH